MNVRELRVTDIRCQAEGCGAGPGEECKLGHLDWREHPSAEHVSRIEEHADLVGQGWEWQEVDPTDKGARKE